MLCLFVVCGWGVGLFTGYLGCADYVVSDCFG